MVGLCQTGGGGEWCPRPPCRRVLVDEWWTACMASGLVMLTCLGCCCCWWLYMDVCAVCVAVGCWGGGGGRLRGAAHEPGGLWLPLVIAASEILGWIVAVPSLVTLVRGGGRAPPWGGGTAIWGGMKWCGGLWVAVESGSGVPLAKLSGQVSYKEKKRTICSQVYMFIN